MSTPGIIVQDDVMVGGPSGPRLSQDGFGALRARNNTDTANASIIGGVVASQNPAVNNFYGARLSGPGGAGEVGVANTSGVTVARMRTATGVDFNADLGLKWSAVSNAAVTHDTGINRGSAGVVEVNNGTKVSLGGELRDLAVRGIAATGGITPASMADADAANGTLYYSPDAGKLVFKDAAGVVNPLY